MTIQRTSDTSFLPVAHTCFNLLDLPEYGTKERWLAAIFFFFFLPTCPRTNSHPNSCNSVTPVSWTASSCHYSPLEKLLSGDLVFTYSFTLVTAKPMLKEKLKFKLSQAIQQTKGFGLV